MSCWTSHSVPLPPELLLYIFSLATTGPTRDIERLIELQPLEGDYSSDVDQLCDATLKTKHSLALTCSLFNNLSQQFLFEDIRVREDSCGLAEALERDPSPGIFVKRVSIFPLGSNIAGRWCASFPENTQHILQKCPNVVLVTRPLHIPVDTSDTELELPLSRSTTTDVGLDDIEFSHLRRVDWFNSPLDMLPSTLPTPRFIWTTKSLTTLTIGPEHFPITQTMSPIVDLPSVTTLRLRSLRSLGDTDDVHLDPASINLPSLKRLVLTLPDGIYNLFFGEFLRFYAPRIHTLELGAHRRFLKHDYVNILMLYCSNATTLIFPVFTTEPTRKNSSRQTVQIIYPVTHIGLSAIGLCKEPERKFVEDGQWERLANHCLSIFGRRSRFSMLEKLTLFGVEWESVIRDTRFRGVLELVRSRKVQIVCEYASVAAALEAVSNEPRTNQIAS